MCDPLTTDIREAKAEARGCDCCDPTSPSPDPVVQRLERELEELTGKAGELTRERDAYRDALYTARRELDVVRGAMASDDERLRTAAARVGIVAGRDAPDVMAHEIDLLRGLLREVREAYRTGYVSDCVPTMRLLYLSDRFDAEAEAALEGKP